MNITVGVFAFLLAVLAVVASARAFDETEAGLRAVRMMS